MKKINLFTSFLLILLMIFLIYSSKIQAETTINFEEELFSQRKSFFNLFSSFKQKRLNYQKGEISKQNFLKTINKLDSNVDSMSKKTEDLMKSLEKKLDNSYNQKFYNIWKSSTYLITAEQNMITLFLTEKKLLNNKESLKNSTINLYNLIIDNKLEIIQLNFDLSGN